LIVKAVGAWIADNRPHELTTALYVLSDLTRLDGWFTAEEIAELRGTDQVWDDHLTDGSHAALDETLGVLVDLQAVEDRESVVDEEAFGELGCHPYIGSRAMLRLQRPLANGDQYFVEANIDQGCGGLVLLLLIEPRNAQFEVIRVIREGSWIV
jgi:hypothetical protein